MRSAAARFFGTYRTKCDSAASFSCMYFKGEGSVALSRACAAQEARTWVVFCIEGMKKTGVRAGLLLRFAVAESLLVYGGLVGFCRLRCLMRHCGAY